MTNAEVVLSQRNGGQFNRRVFCGMLALALAACTQTIMPTETAEGVSIRNVSVSTSELGQMSVRGLPISRQQFATDLTTAIEREISSSRSSSGNANLYVSVTRVLLVSPEQSFLVGGRSFIDAKVRVSRVSDGTLIAGPVVFSGLSDDVRMGGIVGAVTAPDARSDYEATVTGFAEMIREAMFEGGSTIY